MSYQPSMRVPCLSLALIASAVLAGCSTPPRAAAVPGATPQEWAAMTATTASCTVEASFTVEALPAASAGARIAAAPAPAASDDAGDLGYDVLMYIPNRIFDLLDIVRLRLRLGPGFAGDIRATELFDAFAGSYSSVFIGIPGPRRNDFPNWPWGYENRGGAEVSVLDAATDGRDGPHYGIAEIGLGVHFLLLGADVGVDPWEAVDFLTGILTIDLVEDDL
jgi:hypothetical protein